MNTARSPTFYAWLSVITSILTISLKFGAFWLTGSIGLLSDAMEGIVNLVAAFIALGTLYYVSAGADEDHNFGHEKAEYFSSGIEGSLIFVAAISIVFAACERLLDPQPLESLGLGVLLSITAAGANALCAMFLLKGARSHRSITLEADAYHLLSDVWTTIGVIFAILLVPVTGWLILDPLVALFVAAQILWTGWKLVKRSFDGLMDKAIPTREVKSIESVLNSVKKEGCDFHALRTRQAGSKHFADVHVLVPGAMSVSASHDLVERLESEVKELVPNVEIMIHVEPLEDPRSWQDHKVKCC